MKLEELREAVAGVDTAALADADRGLRVLDPGVRPVRSGLALFGRARTVRCHEDFLAVLWGLRDAVPGEVLVVDTQDSRRAVAGELFATEAARRGLAGLVIDGACRDTAQLEQLAIPVYARFSNPRAGSADRWGENQVPIRCGGVRIAPGEILFGDADGVVVATEAELLAALPRAREIQATEAQLRTRIEAGESLLDLTNLQEHAARVRRGSKSALRFVL
jgi:4-hydroxy-4-methyl-2-oxoglutarate aldolase